MDCAQAHSYPPNSGCDVQENDPWEGEYWLTISEGVSKTPRVKEWVGDLWECEQGFRTEIELVRGKIACNLSDDTGSARCYVQFNPQLGYTSNYSNMESGFTATTNWQALPTLRFGTPTTGGEWTASDYFANFEDPPEQTDCGEPDESYGWIDGGEFSSDCTLDLCPGGNCAWRNYKGWVLDKIIFVEPVFPEE